MRLRSRGGVAVLAGVAVTQTKERDMLSQAQLNELLEQVKPSIVEGFKKEIQSSLTYNVMQQVSTVIRGHVDQWLKENVIPDITAFLVENKEGIIKVAPALADKMCEQLTVALTTEMAARLQNQWSRKKIFQAMLSD